MSFVDESALVLHVLAATALVGGGIAQVMAGARVRSATTGSELASWARFTRSGGLVIAVAAFLSLMTGGHLAAAVWTTESSSGFSQPFISLGAAGLLLLAPVGPMVGGAALRRLAAAADETGPEPLPGPLRAQAVSPGLWGPVHSLVGVGAGLVWLMSAKPSWGVGAVGLLVTFGVGWLAGVVAARSAGR